MEWSGAAVVVVAVVVVVWYWFSFLIIACLFVDVFYVRMSSLSVPFPHPVRSVSPTWTFVLDSPRRNSLGEAALPIELHSIPIPFVYSGSDLILCISRALQLTGSY